MNDYVFSERATKNRRAEIIDVHRDGKNIAYVRALPKKKFVYIDSLYVSPSDRGKDLSKELLKRVIDKYKTKELRLQADPFKDKPINVSKLKKLYSRFGFESVGRWQMVRKPEELKKLAAFTESFSDELEKIAQVKPYQQKTQWTCSAACLKAVLEHWGAKFPELVIIEAIGAKKGRGAECNEIAAAARKLGFSSFEYSFDSIEQAKVLLDQDIPIICDIQSFNNPGKGHYVVMHAANDQVELMDPNTPGNTRIISKQEMEQRWWDHAMAPPHELMPKHGIIVIPRE